MDIEALAKLGNKAKEAIPASEDALQDRQFPVQIGKSIAKALIPIRGSPRGRKRLLPSYNGPLVCLESIGYGGS